MRYRSLVLVACLLLLLGWNPAHAATEQLYKGDLTPEIGLGCSDPSGTSGGPNDWAVGVTATLTPPFNIVSTTYNVFTQVSPNITSLNFMAWAGGASPGAVIGSQSGMPYAPGGHTVTLATAIAVTAGQAPGGQFYFGLSQPQTNVGMRIGEDTSSASAGTSFARVPGCGSASFATVDSLGFPGNWVMAAVIDDQVAVELTLLDDTILGQPGAADACLLDPNLNNGVIDPGEEVTIPAELTATGGDFTGISGTLTSNTAGVTVGAGTQSYPNIDDGQSAAPNAPFTVSVDQALRCGTPIDLTLTVTANEGGPFVLDLTGEVGSAAGGPCSICQGASIPTLTGTFLVLLAVLLAATGVLVLRRWT